MVKLTTTVGVLGALAMATLTGNAIAAEDDCPPDAFCDDVDYGPIEGGGAQTDKATPAEQAGDKGASDKATTEKETSKTEQVTVTTRTKAKSAADSVTVVLPEGTTGKPRVFVVRPGAEGAAPEVTEYHPNDATQQEPPKKLLRPRHRRWGLNMRVEGLVSPDEAGDSQMGGLGLELRYRPVPAFALALSLDVLGGQDPLGYERREVPVSVSGMLFAFSRSPIQPYLVLGVNASFARVEAREYTPLLKYGTHANYTYVGAHAGLGLEFRVTQLIGLNVDGLVFARQRVDEDAQAYPELIDADTGEASNASGGGMVRGGLTFWW